MGRCGRKSTRKDAEDSGPESTNKKQSQLKRNDDEAAPSTSAFRPPRTRSQTKQQKTLNFTPPTSSIYRRVPKIYGSNPPPPSAIERTVSRLHSDIIPVPMTPIGPERDRKLRHIQSISYLKNLTLKAPFKKPDMCRIRNLRAMCIDVALIYLKGSRFYDALKFMYVSGMYATKLSIMKVNPSKYHLQFYLPKVSIHPFAVVFTSLRLVLSGVGNFRLWGHLHLEFINVIFEDTERNYLIDAVKKLEPRSINLINCACNRPSSQDEVMGILEELVGSKKVSVIGTRSLYERPYYSTDPDPGKSEIDNTAPKQRKKNNFHSNLHR